MVLTIFNESYKEYYKIIEEAKNMDRSKILDRNHKNYIYYENHHIIPKSLGGSNVLSNLVLLTPEEHYVCHSLLPDFCEGSSKHKMLYAWNILNKVGNLFNNIIGPKKYGLLKRNFDAINSGDNSPHAKSIYQINKDTGNIIREWASVASAAKELNISRANISDCACDKVKTAGKYAWLYTQDYNEDKVIEITSRNYSYIGKNARNVKNIYQVNTNTGKLIKEWVSATEAAKELKLNYASICSCANGRIKTAGGFIWLHPKNYNIQKKEEIKRKTYGIRTVYQIDIQTQKIIKKWDGVVVAAKELKLNKVGIRLCALGIQKKSQGYSWVYPENYKRKNNEQ